ncbi:hypothetical protein V1505DRAFT_91218 [Lipomyces doorenjongii]
MPTAQTEHRRHMTHSGRFTEWCDEREFVDGQLATESKLIAFLHTELIERGCWNRKEHYTVNTLKLHMAAITDLWKQQVDFGINPHQRPRTTNVQAILSTYSMNAHERKRQKYADRGAGSLFDGYNSEGMLKNSSGHPVAPGRIW